MQFFDFETSHNFENMEFLKIKIRQICRYHI